MAKAVGTIAAVVAIIDVIRRAFVLVASAVHASKELGHTVERIVNMCQDVKTIAEKCMTLNSLGYR
jgi:hypothetical protein